MATTVNKSPSGVQTRFSRRSRPTSLVTDTSQISTRNSLARLHSAELPNSVPSEIKVIGSKTLWSLQNSFENSGTLCDSNQKRCDQISEKLTSHSDHDVLSLIENGEDKEVHGYHNGDNQDHDVDLVREVESTSKEKSKSGRHFRSMVTRLAPTPGFVDKNSLPADLMSRRRVRRVASLNAAAKVNVFFEPSSPLAGRSLTDIMQHSKKGHGGEGEISPVHMSDGGLGKGKGRPKLVSISTNDSNFLPSQEGVSDAAHVFLRNRVPEGNSENANGFKRCQEDNIELYDAKRAKRDGCFTGKFEQTEDDNMVIADRRLLKGKEVVDVGLQVKIPKPTSEKKQISGDHSVLCTCRSSTTVDIPIKSYISTYADGTLVSVPITKTHRLNPRAPEKPLPELVQGDIANRSSRVAGLNSRAMLNAILCQERRPSAAEGVTKPRKLPQRRGYYEHGLSNTIPSKLKIPKINFAATSTSNFGGRGKFLGSQKTPSTGWPKTGPASHDGPKRTNGWFYLGSPIVKPFFYNDTKVMRKYYVGIKRNDEVIYVRDSVLLKSGPRRKDLPFVARVSGFWEEEEGPHAGEMMMSVLWFYRPEQTEMGKQPHIHGENEILGSRHKDDNSVACIVDKCYVLSYPEYCRHRAALKRAQDSRLSSTTPVPPAESTRADRERIPSTCDPKLVFFCRQIYDYRMGRILKNPLMYNAS